MIAFSYELRYNERENNEMNEKCMLKGEQT